MFLDWRCSLCNPSSSLEVVDSFSGNQRKVCLVVSKLPPLPDKTRGGDWIHRLAADSLSSPILLPGTWRCLICWWQTKAALRLVSHHCYYNDCCSCHCNDIIPVLTHSPNFDLGLSLTAINIFSVFQSTMCHLLLTSFSSTSPYLHQ